jgi:hypothetical protein
MINKMVLINGDEILVYKLDTDQTFLSRIASHFNTLPKYIYGLPDNFISVEQLKIKDILSLIKKDASKSTDFDTFLEKNKDRLGNLDTKKDILYVWLSYNKNMEDMSEYSSAILDQFADPFVKKEYFSSPKEFVQFWKTGRESVKKDLEIKIKQQKAESKKYTDLYEIFENIEEGLGFTEFNTERVMLSMILDLKDITILEIFNHLLLNESIPFAICKNYYKILKDYIPPEDWTIQGDDSIMLKMHEKIIVDPAKHKDYTDVKISVSGDISKEIVSVLMKLTTERGYLSRDKFIDRFMNAFSNKNTIAYKNVDETEVLGVFYFPQERINTYVFSDLVMNNILFASLINIDESSKATKKKTESSQPWLYIHFNHPSTGHITAAITQKIVDRSDSIMREEDAEIFPHGQPYIRVRAKGRDRKSVEFFQEMFAKLLVLYGQKYNEIVEIYEQFIPDFGVVEQIDVPVLKQTDLAPEIFVSNFSRYCSEERNPTIVSDKQAKKFAKEGKEVMTFPRNIPENGQTYLSDGKNQYNYVCLNPEFPYPGLQVNTKLSNSEEFPYLPCCFKNEQSNKSGGIYRKYYFGEELEIKDKKQQELITTDKILNVDKYGTLPNELQKLFEILDTNTNYKYIRIGVHRNHSSFLNAVMVGLHDQTGILDLDETKREAKILEIRNELSAKNIATMARQCCYDETTNQISQNLANPEIYMDPKFYSQLLESYFNCNIFLFNRDKMVLPRFTQSFYKNHRVSDCVFIFEHWGSESDNAKYPQCELIIRWNTKKKDDTEYFFPYENKISRNMNKVFRLMNESYSLNKKIPETIFPIPDEIKIISQTIDSYGKTRCVNVNYKGTVISIITDPIPPLPVVETNELYKTKKDNALELLRKLGIEPSSQVAENPSEPVLIQINSVLGNVGIAVPIHKSTIISGLSTFYGVTYPQKDSSALDTFNNNKKIVRYMTEYLFWLFSNYIQNDNIEQITDKVLAKFAKKTFVIDPKHKYEMVPKLFGNNNGIMRNGQMVVQSEEVIKRLMYILKLYSVRDIKTLRSYYIRRAITHYYVDITDFDYHPSQVILQGEDSIDKWIQESKFVNNIHRDIVVGQPIPYFFKNDLVDEDKVFLAQNANSLEMAIAVGLNWQKYGYNSGMDTDNTTKKYAFTLYSYVNSDNITVRKVTGKQTNSEIRIMGYKLSGSPFYTTLLDLH